MNAWKINGLLWKLAAALAEIHLAIWSKKLSLPSNSHPEYMDSKISNHNKFKKNK